VRQVYNKEMDFDGYHVEAVVVETDAPTNPGDSGGPVVNDHLQLIAVVQSLHTRDRLVSNNIAVEHVQSFLSKYLHDHDIAPELPSPPVSTEQIVDVPTLISRLQATGPEDREKAAQELAERGAEAQAAIPALIPLLRDEDRVRRAAEKALEQIGPPAKGDYSTVIGALTDWCPQVRIYAARTVAGLEEVPPNILTMLLSASKDTESEVRCYAVIALRNFASAGPHHRNAAVPVLLEMLSDLDDKVHRTVAEALDKLDLRTDQDFEALSRALKHKNPEVRIRAVGALARGEVSRPVLTALLPALGDTELRIRQLAIQTLGKAGPDDKALVYPLLMEALKDKDQVIRSASLAALEKIGPPEVTKVPDLAAALGNPQAEVRVYAAQALYQLGVEAKGAVPALAEALRDSDRGVVQLAAAALGKIGPEAKPAVPGLIQVAQHTDEGLRRPAVIALAKIGRARGSLRAVIAALDDREAEVRESALSALQQFWRVDKEDIPDLETALKSKRPEVRTFAVTTLGDLGPDAVPALIEALDDTEPEVRKLAVVALDKIGAKDAVPRLAALLDKDNDQDSRHAIVLALGRRGPDAAAAVPALGRVLERDHILRGEAAMALGAVGPAAKPAVPLLITGLADQEVGDAAALALARIGKPAVPALAAALTDWNRGVRFRAVTVLGQIGPDAQAAVGELAKRANKDRSVEVKQAARSALRKIQPTK
jgi:HEAT repeat protein